MFSSLFKYTAAATFCLLSVADAKAQYAPQAGITGSDAVSRSSATISSWATGCSIQRGLQQIGNAAGGYASSGDSSLATGMADGTVVSLGDSGVATLTFASSIVNGPGADFAVFENGFLNPANSEEAFLELAFVEVSSDGANFFRFPATSLTQDTVQVSSVAGLSYMNARQLHNLAGKYIASWGTPFDLSELAGISGLNINNITHVRLIDVTGDIGVHKTTDSSGLTVNDPFPTPFPTGGFDLDAVAVMHQRVTGISTLGHDEAFAVYPNPATDQVFIQRQAYNTSATQLQLTDGLGRVLVQQTMFGRDAQLSVRNLPAGMYYLSAQDEKGEKWIGRILKK